MAKTPTEMELHALSPLKWVEEEMRRQVAKWGVQDKNPFMYYTALAEEFGEAGAAINRIVEGRVGREEGLLEVEYELIQTAAVAVSIVAAIRRAQGTDKPNTPIRYIDNKGEFHV